MLVRCAGPGRRRIANLALRRVAAVASCLGSSVRRSIGSFGFLKCFPGNSPGSFAGNSPDNSVSSFGRSFPGSSGDS